MDVSASLKLSFMGGLVQVSGSAKYLDDRTSSTKQERVILNYKCTTRFETLSMEHLGKGNFQHPDIFDGEDATHVVTGILYGGHAVLLFDKQHSDNDAKRELEGSVDALVKAIPSFQIEGRADLQLTEKEKEQADSLNVKFYGDIIPPINPSTYAEAVQLYKTLPGLMGKEDQDAVPLMVWLYPLCKLDSKAAKLVREISTNLVNTTEKIFEQLHEHEIKCNDLMKTEACKNFRGLYNEVLRFKEMVTEYKIEFQKQLLPILSNIRGGGAKETDLAKILKQREQSPFSERDILLWLHQKESEAKVLDQYLESMNGIQFAKAPGDLEAARLDLRNKHVVCFMILRSGKHPHLSAMKTYLDKPEPYTQIEQTTGQYLFHEDENWGKSMIKNGRAFVDYYYASQSVKGTKFIIAEQEASSKSGGYIYLFKDNMTIDEDFEPPSAPGTPTLSYIGEDRITLFWPEPKHGNSYVTEYEVICNEGKEDERCFKMSRKSDGNVVSKLQPETFYEFKVRACSNPGLSLPSNVSQKCKTSAADPVAGSQIVKEKLLSKSKRIKGGSPSIYQLLIKETYTNERDRIRKCELGKRDQTMTEKVIMVVGATGSGKSTLINGMINYIFGVGWDDEFRFKLIVETAPGQAANQAKSQTSWITSYTINHKKGYNIPYTLTIIDTPGFGDTSGIMKDKKITEQIRSFFTTAGPNGIDHIDAVGFVAQSSLPRLTPTQQYIFDSILSLFGKDIADNIFMLLTFADGQKPPVLDGLAEARLPFKKYFKFNNSALFAGNSVDDDSCFDEMFWKMGTKSFRLFITDFLREVEPQTLILTKDVLNERHHLEVYIQAIQFNIQEVLNKLEQLTKEVQVLKEHEADINKNKDFYYTVEEEKAILIPIDLGTYTTTCIPCKRTCHLGCYIKDDGNKGRCIAMDENGNCTACPSLCHWSKHKNLPHKYEIVRESVRKTSTELKARYEDAKGKKLSATQLIEEVLNEFEKIQVKVICYTESVRLSIRRLEEIALKPNPLSTTEYIDILIETEKAQADPGWKQRLEQLTEVRKQAECMKKLADKGLNPFEKYKDVLAEVEKSGVGIKQKIQKYINPRNWFK